MIAGCNPESGKDEFPSIKDTAPTIYATFSSNGSRTSINDELFGDLVWDAGDNINLFIGAGESNNLKYTTSEGGSTAEFKIADDESKPAGDADEYVGLFPYNANASYDGISISTVVPTNQKAIKGSYDPSAFISAGKSTNTAIGFGNVCGGIRFTLENPEITSVKLRGCDNETLAGTISIGFGSDDIPVATSMEKGNRVITLEADSRMGSDEESFYYITIIPQTFQKGFKMEFYVGENKYSSCTCETPVSVQAGTFITVRKADNPETLGAHMNGTDLSANAGPANCYIVSEAGTYKFPACVGDSVISNVAYVGVLWESDNSSTCVLPKAIIERCNYRDSYIHFATPEELVDGNAVIAAYDEFGHIVWSWHIWICRWYEPQAQSYKGTSMKMMDRNLGALSNNQANELSRGLLYQWGRKDPFPADGMATTGEWQKATNKEVAASEIYCIEHPMTFYMMLPACYNEWYYASTLNDAWANVKSKYDPCPAGWKIPSGADGTSAWNISEEDRGIDTDGGWFTLADGASRAWYPFCGYIDSGTGNNTGSGIKASYWTSTIEDGNAVMLEISSNGSTDVNQFAKSGKLTDGRSVRCVKEQ